MKKILVLAPHTDDGEIGCGGTVARLIEEGADVYYAAFSVCEESVPEGMPKDTLEKEVKNATSALGIDKSHLYIFRYPVRKFSEHRQEILEDLVKLKKEISPDTVFMTGKNDIHQDHQIIANEGVRAFKNCTILCYEMVWNNFSVNTTALFKLEQHHIDKKIDALREYTSQQNIRSYMDRDFIESLAKVRGVQAGTAYAEAFEVVRWIV